MYKKSKWKVPYLNYSFLFLKKEKNSYVIYDKSAVIVNNYVGFLFRIYNGKSFKLLKINKNMVGHRFGEFVFTRKIGKNIHNKK